MNYKILDSLNESDKNTLYSIIHDIVNLSNDEIDTIYNEQRNAFDKDEFAKKLKPDLLMNDFNAFKDCKGLGIDLPCWIDWNSSKEKMFIIARDPQRNHTNNSLVVGSPFSMVAKGGREAKNNYWNFIEPLIKNYRLYITDINKLFILKPTEKKTELTKLKIHKEILKREIDLFHPLNIVTIGKDAANAVKEIFEIEIHKDEVYCEMQDKKFYFIPHLSNQVSSGIIPIANLFKGIGMLRKEENFTKAGEKILELKDKLFDKLV